MSLWSNVESAKPLTEKVFRDAAQKADAVLDATASGKKVRMELKPAIFYWGGKDGLVRFGTIHQMLKDTGCEHEEKK